MGFFSKLFGNPSKTVVAKLDKILFVNPGTEFCS